MRFVVAILNAHLGNFFSRRENAVKGGLRIRKDHAPAVSAIKVLANCNAAHAHARVHVVRSRDVTESLVFALPCRANRAL